MKFPLAAIALVLPAALAQAQTEPARPPQPKADQAVQEQQESETAEPARPRRTPTDRGFRPSFKWGVEDFLLEARAFGQAEQADVVSTLRLIPYLTWQPRRELEVRAGVRVDSTSQQGGAADYTRWQADVADSYLRYRSGDTRLTAGAQTIVWGRVDEISMLDRVSRVDLTRFAIDKLAERRRAQLALRWEQAAGDYKLDTVLLPAVFRGARLPDARSVWSPINRLTGEVTGIAPSPELSGLVRTATILDTDGGAGGGAMRLTRTGIAPLDLGLTLARTRQSLPYFRADPVARTLTAEHPYTSFAGADVEWSTGDFTWRSELGLTRGYPATLTSGAMIRTRAVGWVGAVEFFPGGKETRVNLQLAAQSLRSSQPILELKNYLNINGEIDIALDQARWRLSARFFSGLNVHDVYVAPRVAYLGWEPHELFITANFFDGAHRTLGGFHRDHRNLAVGLKSRF